MSFVARNHPQQTDRRGALDVVDDRRTLPDTFDECRALAGVTGYDLDAAASRDNRLAPDWWAIKDDGLSRPWWGRVWCNPPYSDIRPWIEKAHAEAERSRSRPLTVSPCSTIAMLLPANRTEQGWWQDLVEPARRDGSLEVYFLRGRRRFGHPEGWQVPVKGDRPPFGLCLLVWS